MSRLVFWIGLIVLIFFALRSKLRAAARNHQPQVPPQRPQGSPHAAPPPVIENMTSCAECGLHFPASEALHAEGRDYCSPAHLPAVRR